MSDSLAAESIKAGGAFASNPGGASAQSSAGSTLANQDTSNATKLEPASSAAQRSTADSEAAAAAADVNKPSGAYTTVAGGHRGSGAGEAPSYVNAGDNSSQKPAGEGLKEGGFNADAPNASFSTDIGGKNDPGRVAEQKFANLNARAGGNAATSQKQDDGVTNDGQFDVLKETSA